MGSGRTILESVASVLEGRFFRSSRDSEVVFVEGFMLFTSPINYVSPVMRVYTPIRDSSSCLSLTQAIYRNFREISPRDLSPKEAENLAYYGLQISERIGNFFPDSKNI